MVARTAAERKRKQRTLDKADPERKHRKLDTLYMFGEVDISVIIDNERNVWFKGVDLARALEIEDPNHAIIQTLDSKYYTGYESLTVDLIHYRDIPDMHPKTTFVNEAGMNLFVLRSRKPKAEKFAEWVCAEVLPSIRKTGKYEILDPNKNPYKELNDFLRQQVDELKKEKDEWKIEKNEFKNEKYELKNVLKTKEMHLSSALDSLSRSTQKIFDMRPSCVMPVKNEMTDEYVMIYRKHGADENIGGNIEFQCMPYYGCRIQLRLLRTKENELKKKYPNLELLLKLKLPNSVNFFNYLFEEMVEILQRGKGDFIQSFGVKNGAVDERAMLDMIKNVYRSQYSDTVDEN